MRIQVMWDDDDKTIIRFQVEPHWTWDEFVAAQQVAYELADTVRHKVGIIIPEAATLPPEAVSGRKDFTFITNRHPNVDIFVLVVRGLLIRGMISLMMKLYTPAASLVVVVATMDEARNLIKGRLEAAS
jgi:hypothetical protein